MSRACESITILKARLPDYAKDIRLNLDAVIAALEPFADRRRGRGARGGVRRQVGTDRGRHPRATRTLDDAAPQAALTAAALMGMNNVWYPFVEMADDADLKTMRAELRMNAYATHGGVDRQSFELYALAASIVGKCEFCVRSHYKLLQETGLTTQQLRDVGRIAAVINAAAQVIAAESSVEVAA